jgi:hypothetical protein
MRKLTYPMIIVALASMPLSPPLSAFAQQRGAGPQSTPSAPHRGTQLAPHRSLVSTHTLLRSQSFGGHLYRGRLAWGNGRWHHETRSGRNGWWWDVGGVWYFYPEPFEGPPDYVSDIGVVDEPTVAQLPAAPPPPTEPHHAVYYRPGDFLGTRYQTLEECQAIQRAGNVGVCVWK